MTFGEHLEELRRRILVGLIAFAAAFVAAFVFQEELMALFTRPYERARAEVNADLLRDWQARPRHGAGADPSDAVVEALEGVIQALTPQVPAETASRLEELAGRLRDRGPPQLGPLQAVGTTETFTAYMMECLLAALIVSAPVLLFELWRFVAAGLYQHERTLVLRVLPFSLALFFGGLAFGYLVLAEMSVRFLAGYGSFEHVVPQVTIASYLGLLFLLLLAMGLVFQIPLVMTVLARTGLLQPAFFRGKRRYFILAIFVIAAIITPPDYISMLLVAGPMLLLFEAGIWLAAAAAKRRQERKPADAT